MTNAGDWVKRKGFCRALVWDIETAPMVTTTWSLWPKALSHDNILRDWYMVSGAWKWLGERKVYDAAINPKAAARYLRDGKSPPDKALVKAVADAVREADFVIAHNGDAFDMKKLNARVIYYGMDPLPEVRSVDTLKEVRKAAKFSSNRLDHLAKTLLPDGGKIKTTYSLWLKVLHGDEAALREMVRYNRKDVTELEALYRRLLPYMKSHPNVNLSDPDAPERACPKCGSTETVRDGWHMAKTRRYRRYRCTACRGLSRMGASGTGKLQ